MIGETGKKPVQFSGIGVIVDKILETDFDNLSIIYNHFNTIISYKSTAKNVPSLNNLKKKQGEMSAYEFEEDAREYHVRVQFVVTFDNNLGFS